MPRDERRTITLTQILGAIGLFATFLGTGAGIIVGFTEHGVAIKQLEQKTLKLEAQSPVVSEVRLLVSVINTAIDEMRSSRKEMIKKFEEAQTVTSQKIFNLTIGQNTIKTQLKAYKHRHKDDLSISSKE